MIELRPATWDDMVELTGPLHRRDFARLCFQLSNSRAVAAVQAGKVQAIAGLYAHETCDGLWLMVRETLRDSPQALPVMRALLHYWRSFPKPRWVEAWVMATNPAGMKLARMAGMRPALEMSGQVVLACDPDGARPTVQPD